MAIQANIEGLTGVTTDVGYLRVDRFSWFRSGDVEYEVLGYLSADHTDKDPIFRETMRAKGLDNTKPLLDQIYADYERKIAAASDTPAANVKAVHIPNGDPILWMQASKISGATKKV